MSSWQGGQSAVTLPVRNGFSPSPISTHQYSPAMAERRTMWWACSASRPQIGLAQ